MQLANITRAEKGVGMIEVLVSVVIISISLLGLAALQIKSVRYNNQAYLRSQATFLADDIIDRIRENRTEAVGGSYIVELTDSGSDSTACETNSCTTSELAKYDVKQWLYSLSTALPLGDGTVSISGNTVSVSIQWDQSQGQSKTTLEKYTVEALL